VDASSPGRDARGGVSGRATLTAPQASGRAGEVNKFAFSDWLDLVRLHWRKQEGQTMAEYGVVLAVISIGALGVFTLLSGGITGDINKFISLLPT
jgi:Flp pilus assembly pilin Flp